MQQLADISQLSNYLTGIGQGHLLEGLDKFDETEISAFISQVNQLNVTYPGGLEEYTKRAKKLLQDSAEDVNPFEGYEPRIPQGKSVTFGSNDFEALEERGVQELKNTCFVLVAGGLGERLGYDGIKIGLPIELVTRTTFLEYYCQYIRAFEQKHSDRPLPFAIMTSDDTHSLTLQLLQNNSYFGLRRDQVTLIKQEKVPAMLDNEARFSRLPGRLLLETKPHGHGDIHTLLYMSGLAKKWNQDGRKWIFIFQDTNPLAFRALPSILGVSAIEKFELNSVTVPRKPGEAVGAFCELKKQDGSSLTMSVEYNQLEPLMKTIGGEPVDEHGYSKLPGNINCLLFALEPYDKVLQESKGLIAEFINPKYADATKTKFKSSSRLECMMQDYPKLLSSANKVGFTQIDRRFCFSACKNDLATAKVKSQANLPLECAGSCEADFYWVNSQLLRLSGASVESTDQLIEINGLKLPLGPKVVLHPSFGVTLSELKQRIKDVKISAKSTAVLAGNLALSLNLDGRIEIKGNGNVQAAVLDQKYDQFVELAGEQPGYLKIREEVQDEDKPFTGVLHPPDQALIEKMLADSLVKKREFMQQNKDFSRVLVVSQIRMDFTNDDPFMKHLINIEKAIKKAVRNILIQMGKIQNKTQFVENQNKLLRLFYDDINIGFITSTGQIKSTAFIFIANNCTDLVSRKRINLQFKKVPIKITLTFFAVDQLQQKVSQATKFDPRTAFIRKDKFFNEFLTLSQTNQDELKTGISVFFVYKPSDDQIYAVKRSKLASKNLDFFEIFQSGIIVNADQRKIREAKILSKLTHPNVLKMFDWWVEESHGEFYLYMQLEYCSFPGFKYQPTDLLTFAYFYMNPMETKLKIQKIKGILHQLLNALEYIHGRGTIHRDLKPENIFVTISITGELQVLLADFDQGKDVRLQKLSTKTEQKLPEGELNSITSQNTITTGTSGYQNDHYNKDSNYEVADEFYAIGIIILHLVIAFPGEPKNRNHYAKTFAMTDQDNVYALFDSWAVKSVKNRHPEFSFKQFTNVLQMARILCTRRDLTHQQVRTLINEL